MARRRARAATNAALLERIQSIAATNAAAAAAAALAAGTTRMTSEKGNRGMVTLANVPPRRTEPDTLSPQSGIMNALAHPAHSDITLPVPPFPSDAREAEGEGVRSANRLTTMDGIVALEYAGIAGATYAGTAAMGGARSMAEHQKELEAAMGTNKEASSSCTGLLTVRNYDEHNPPPEYIE